MSALSAEILVLFPEGVLGLGTLDIFLGLHLAHDGHHVAVSVPVLAQDASRASGRLVEYILVSHTLGRQRLKRTRGATEGDGSLGRDVEEGLSGLELFHRVRGRQDVILAQFSQEILALPRALASSSFHDIDSFVLFNV